MSERVFKKPEGLAPDIEFIRPSLLAEEGKTGVLLEGTFVSALPSTFDEAKNDYKFELEDGKVIVINHSGSLAKQMSAISPGDYCQVSYLGKKEIESGKFKGKEAHKFDVLIA